MDCCVASCARAVVQADLIANICVISPAQQRQQGGTTCTLVHKAAPTHELKQSTQQRDRLKAQDLPEVRLTIMTAPVQNKEGVAGPVIEDVSCQSQGACCPHWLFFLQQDKSRHQHPGACCWPPNPLWLRPCQDTTLWLQKLRQP